MNTTVRVQGEIDFSSCEPFRAALDEAVRRGGDVTLDCSELAFIGAAGMHLVIGAAKALEPKQLVIIDDGWIAHIADLLNLCDLFPNITITLTPVGRARRAYRTSG
ncbi:STAS domain-containing protein [Lentzea tibetensis]|uniref:STAS domain-containing protein n=1 Tax=Lentzea tibetensis TaxID=2591470 RepID=A0A563EV85_9PSEU|nr:STAS domain-containing protein [Lentzea tibetensis]TWP51458.1 STAS domain-containing protein [Lentzea tibetensis]